MAVYADTSALVKLVLDESGSEALVTYLGRHVRVASSVVASVELVRAAARKDLRLVPFVQSLLNDLELIPLTNRVISSAALVGPVALRTLDAIHIASALVLGDELEVLITYDQRMAEAAEALGIRVLSPR